MYLYIYTFTYMYHTNQIIHVGKHTSPMDGMDIVHCI